MKFPFHPGDILTERRPAETSAAQSDCVRMGRFYVQMLYERVRRLCCGALSAQVFDAEQHWRENRTEQKRNQWV